MNLISAAKYEIKKEELWRDFGYRVNKIIRRIEERRAMFYDIYNSPVRTPADSLGDALWPICNMASHLKWVDLGTYVLLTEFVTDIVETRLEEYENALKMFIAQKTEGENQ